MHLKLPQMQIFGEYFFTVKAVDSKRWKSLPVLFTQLYIYMIEKVFSSLSILGTFFDAAKTLLRREEEKCGQKQVKRQTAYKYNSTKEL